LTHRKMGAPSDITNRPTVDSSSLPTRRREPNPELSIP
jgi:hypothetical protein